MAERPSEGGADRSMESVRKTETPSLAKSSETQEDLRTKEVFSSVVEEIRPAMQADVEDMRKLVKELREREYSFTNFVSPENMLGQSTWIRGDGKTFSGERLETIESMLEVLEMRLRGMARMEGLLKSGATLEAVKKDPSAAQFLGSPEGQLMQGVVFSNKDPKTLEAEYYLAKARELKSGIIRGDELAQGWYDKLDGTPLEKIGKEERMSLGSKSLRKGREFANSMLGLDSLAMMVAGAGLGRLAGTLISKSDKFRNAALATTTALNESKIARAAMPGVSALRSKAGESVVMKLSKGSANFFAEIGKGFAYTEAARAVGGEDLAHAVSYPLMFIPGLRSEFEGSLKVALAEKPENFRVFARWLIQKYKSPEKLEAAIASGLREADARSRWNFGVDEAKQILASLRSDTVKLFERFSPKKPEAASESPKKTPSATASVGEKAGTVMAESVKRMPDMRKIAEKDLMPEERDFLEKHYFNGTLEKSLGVRVGLENYVNRGFHGAVFEVPGTNQVVKLPLRQEELATLGAEMRRHEVFEGAFQKVQRSYPEILSGSNLDPEVIALRQSAAKHISVPFSKSIPGENPIYSMDKVSDSVPVDYFKMVYLIQKDFPDFLLKNRIDLRSMGFADIDALSNWLYAQRGVPRPNTNSVSLPLFHKEQMNSLVDIVKAMNQSGTYHGDLHQGNVLIGKDAIPGTDFRKISIIDFGTAGKQSGSPSRMQIESPMSGGANKSLDDLMERYPDATMKYPDVITIYHALGDNIIP